MIVLPWEQARLAVTGHVTVCFVPIVRVNQALKYKPRVGHSERVRIAYSSMAAGRVIVVSWFECTLSFLMEDTIIAQRALKESGFTLEEFAVSWTGKEDPVDALKVLDGSTEAFAVTFQPDASQAPRLLSSSGSSRGDERGYNSSSDDIDAGEALSDEDLLLITRRARQEHTEHRQAAIDSLDLRQLKSMPGKDARAARRRSQRRALPVLDTRDDEPIVCDAARRSVLQPPQPTADLGMLPPIASLDLLPARKRKSAQRAADRREALGLSAPQNGNAAEPAPFDQRTFYPDEP